MTTHRDGVGDVDIVVIGAGINGLATAREAAAQGLSVVLIDRDDIGARTSAISTRLIHGGLKYLERMELNLVHESIRERNILLDQAPHLVRPYPMLIPFSSSQSRPGWLLSCGLMLHDVLSLGKRLPRNGIVFRRRLERDWPSLAEAGLRWAGLFQDAQVPLTERLTVELAIDAQRNGAVVLTHAPVEGLLREDGRIAGVVYRDREDGAPRTVRARRVVNAAGPWVDEILDLAGDHDRRIGPTKGSHCVVDPFPGAPDTCVFFESPNDTRPMFVLPWLGRYMIGTTDLPYDGGIDDIRIDDEETDYLLSAVNTLIPSAGLERSDVIWSYSGVRPLPYVGELDDPSTVTRDHVFIEHEGADAGLVTVVGGKLTTHRALGEQLVRRLRASLGLPRRSSPTRSSPLPGRPAEASWPAYRSAAIAAAAVVDGVGPALAERLVDTYGSASETIVAAIAERPDRGRVVDEDSGACAAELVFAVAEEGAHTLEDVLLRRTAIGLNADVGIAAARPAAAVLVEEGLWSPDRAEAETERYLAAVERFTPRRVSH
ncbi:glycerol-3-phosphate dehydrogenase [Mycetocola reblochoni]|uniref:Glycerol-3-phosphate dehydrogenase n=1 Tax=Mycetocola reblochoni TaxID=331618 RepID=A0A3L6ZKW7_9MICO|nr:glycerol-3-phosphate dehydrogenase [Mycetocola reblochoni]